MNKKCVLPPLLETVVDGRGMDSRVEIGRYVVIDKIDPNDLIPDESLIGQEKNEILRKAPLISDTFKGWVATPDWIIFGGESGPGRRPMERKWADDLLDECRHTATSFFMKQFSAATPDAGKALIPAELLIREFPRSSAAE